MEIDVPVAISNNNRYSKEELLHLGAQVTLHQHVTLNKSVAKLILSLSIDRNAYFNRIFSILQFLLSVMETKGL